MKYTYRSGGPKPKLEAQVVGEELERIRQKHDGKLLPANIVDESRPKTAVLHPEFEWNDKKAAELYRQYRARNIVNVVRVVPESPAGSGDSPQASVPAFVNVVVGSAAAPEDRSYRAIEDVLNNPQQRAALIDQALKKLMRVRREYAALHELSAIWAAFDAAVEELAEATT